MGTFRLLEPARAYWNGLVETDKAAFRFLHVSPDEGYGTLGANDPAFTETTPYAPNSPHPASRQPVITWCGLTITPSACLF